MDENMNEEYREGEFGATLHPSVAMGCLSRTNRYRWTLDMEKPSSGYAISRDAACHELSDAIDEAIAGLQQLRERVVAR